MSNDTLSLLKAALARAGDPNELAKAFTFSQNSNPTQGLQPYDLEPAAKNLYPVLTPLRNRIPRVGNGKGSQANWKSVVALDPTAVHAGVSEGHRGGLISYTMKENFAAYRTLGMESSVTDEAELAAADFDDIRARASNMLLQSLMVAEEKVILGGNTSNNLGLTPTPTLVASNTGGTLPTGVTVSVICVALTFEGRNRSSMATGVQGQVTRVTADGYTENFGGGSAQKSAAATVTTGATNTGAIVAAITPVRGAYAYAWYVGTVGNEMLAAITGFSQYPVTALPVTGQLASVLPASDNSTNILIHDGLLAMIGNSTGGSYYQAATPGQGLTADGVGGIVEFDTVLQYFWDTLRLSPTSILVSSQEMLWIRRKILAGGAAAGQSSRFVFNIQQGQIVGGGMPKGYLNPFAMSGGPAEIPIELHPNMPPGTVLFMTETLPYPMNNITNVLQVKARRDYYQIEWPKRTRAYEYGVYSDQVLQNYFMPGFGVITGLAAA